MDIKALLKLKQAWDSFRGNHPKFADFLGAVSGRGVVEGTVIEMTVKYPDGTSMKTNLQVKPSDLDLMEVLKSL